MKTPKFKRSNIKISGIVYISTNHEGYQEQDIRVDIPEIKFGKSGVYEIRNKLNGKRYIGMSDNLHRRMLRHFRDLNNGTHHASEEMENDLIDGTGSCEGRFLAEDVYEFNVIIYCRPSELTFYEHLLITQLNPEYNKHKSSKGKS